MPSHAFALFLVVTLTVLVVPGPSVVFVVTSTLQHGPRGGLRAVAGLETGLLVHVAAASFGLSALVASSPVALVVLRVAGAAYLAVLGLARLREARGGLHGGGPGPLTDASGVFRAGFLVDVLNPKTALFFLALFPQFIDPSRGGVPVQSLALGGLVLVLATLCDGAYAVAAALLHGRRRRVRPSRLVPFLPGAALLCLAVLTAAS